MAYEQKEIIIYRRGIEDGWHSGYACARRERSAAASSSLFKCWLVGALGAAMTLLVSGSRDWQTILTTTGTGGSVGFIAAWVMDRGRN